MFQPMNPSLYGRSFSGLKCSNSTILFNFVVFDDNAQARMSREASVTLAEISLEKGERLINMAYTVTQKTVPMFDHFVMFGL